MPSNKVLARFGVLLPKTTYLLISTTFGAEGVATLLSKLIGLSCVMNT